MKLFRLITVAVLLGGVFTACGGGDDPTQVFTPPPPPPPPPPPTGPAAVTFSLEAFALAIGDVLELSVDVTDASGGTITAPTVTWETSHATAITVTGAGTSATVEAVGAGSATITATSESVSGTSDGGRSRFCSLWCRRATDLHHELCGGWLPHGPRLAPGEWTSPRVSLLGTLSV